MSDARPVARGDQIDTVSTFHPCQPITKTLLCSTNVFVNGTGVHRDTDTNVIHLVGVPPVCPPHQTAINVASQSVFANQLGVARVQDGYACGAAVISGSGNVNAGGPSLPGVPVPPGWEL